MISVTFCHSRFIHLASSLASPVSFFCSVLCLSLRCRLSYLLSWSACCLGRSLFKVNCGRVKQSELHNSCLASPVAFFCSVFMLWFALPSGLSLLCMLPRLIAVLHSHWMIVVPSIVSRTYCLSNTRTPDAPT